MTQLTCSVEQAQKMIKDNKDNQKFKILDVRTGLERCLSHIPNSQHISYFDMESRWSQLNKDCKYLVYCRSGHRSLNSTKILRDHEINAVSMDGGMNAWREDTTSSCSLI